MEKILSIVLQARDEASKEIEKVADKVLDTKTQFEKLSLNMRVAGGILTGVGVAGLAVMNEWATAAGEAQVQSARTQAILSGVASSTGLALTELQQSVNDTAKAYIQLAFDDETTSEVMAKNISVTHDVAEAKKLLAIQADLARSKSIGLEQAQALVQSAMMGNTRVLKQFGIELDDNASKQETLSAISQAVAGQAQEYSKTWQAAMQTLNIEIGNLKEALGERLLPQFTEFVKGAAIIVQSINDMDPRIVDIAVKVVAIGTAFSVIVGPLLIFLSYVPAIVQGASTIAGVIGGITIAGAAMATGIGVVVAYLAAIWSMSTEDFKKNAFNISYYLRTLQQNFDYFGQVVGDKWGSMWVNMKNRINDTVGSIINRLRELWDWIQRVASSSFGGMSVARAFGMSFADGGFVPATGPALVHSGEYVLSRDMLSGRQSIDPSIISALQGSGSRSVVINLGGVNVNSRGDADYLVAQLSAQLRNSGGI